ncbi:hypothetical protein [Pontitalea aquivivens]|uniref:hypothetical protein n=1 Tax=Pontitalea aquivivens TaxID=3388663 RepID=UPI0039711343
MIYTIAAVLGAIIGYRRAVRRGGNGFDRAQYATVHAIAFGLAGLFVTLMIDRAW